MFNSKYSNVLTVILIIIIILIVGLLGFLGYDMYRKYFITKDTSSFIEEYDGQIGNKVKENVINEIDDGTLVNLVIDNTTSSQGGSSDNKIMYKEFEVVGKIEIPKTNIQYPILAKLTRRSIEVAVAVLYGPGINEPGNTIILGHNYRNGLFFSNNKKLVNGDKIYITDNSGRTLEYVVYDIFQTTESDTSFYNVDTGGIPEISLQTCTDDSKLRLIVRARAQ